MNDKEKPSLDSQSDADDAEFGKFYTWFVRLEGKLDKLIDKTHSIDKDVTVIKEKTSDLSGMKTTIQEIEKTAKDIPEIKKTVERHTKIVWWVGGLIAGITLLYQLLSKGIIIIPSLYLE